MCSQISSTVWVAAISSSREAMSTPMKQGWRMGGQATRTCTSAAPAWRNSANSGPDVLPRTIESSTSTTRLPERLAGSGLNFIATRAWRSASVGSMNVRPM
jgi:hypothetical protein